MSLKFVKRHLHQWSMSSRKAWKLWKSVLHRAKHNSRWIWRQETLFPQMTKSGWMLQVKSTRRRFQHGWSDGWGYLQSCQCDGFQSTCENAAANNGDNDIDDDTLIEPPLSCHEALQAKITIEKYIETINEPYTWKLGSILFVDFACSTQLTETKKWKSHYLQIILHVNRYYCSINHIMVV